MENIYFWFKKVSNNYRNSTFTIELYNFYIYLYNYYIFARFSISRTKYSEYNIFGDFISQILLVIFILIKYNYIHVFSRFWKYVHIISKHHYSYEGYKWSGQFLGWNYYMAWIQILKLYRFYKIFKYLFQYSRFSETLLLSTKYFLW